MQKLEQQTRSLFQRLQQAKGKQFDSAFVSVIDTHVLAVRTRRELVVDAEDEQVVD